MTANSPQIIPPTIGRKVWYWPSLDQIERAQEEKGSMPRVLSAMQALDATIVYVWGDRMVNLAITDHTGLGMALTSVPLLQEGDPIPESGGYAQWMPYQVGQARKDTTQSAAETVNVKYDESLARAKDAQDASTQRLASAFKTVAASASISREPSQRDRLEQALVAGIACHIGNEPGKAGKIAEGIKVVLDALHPQHETTIGFAGTFGQIEPSSTIADAYPPTVPVDWGTLPPPQLIIGDKAYPDGTTATGVAPLPAESPATADDMVIPPAGGATIISTVGAKWEPGQAPRVLQSHVEEEIVDESYTVLPSGRVTICELTLQNGFTVWGSSAVVFSENNVPETGRKIAREKAVDQVWQLLGYALREKHV